MREGSEKAFRAIYDQHYKLMLGVGINILKDIDSAKEVVQEVFYQFWKNRETVKEDISIRNYLKRAVINRCINFVKYNARFTGDEALSYSLSEGRLPDEEMENNELREVIDAAIANLPEKARVIFVLRRQEGISLKEIAEQLDISPKTVENQITRAIKILKTELEPYLKKINRI